MSRQAIRNLVGQVLLEQLTYQITKDLESVQGHENLDEETQVVVKNAMASSPVFEGDNSTTYGEFRGERVILNSPYKGTKRDYMAYVRKEGKVVQVHFDAREADKDINENQFGFGEFPKKKVYIQLMDRARKDGLLSDIHYDNKKIRDIAIKLATEFEKMEEPNRQSNKNLFLSMFYREIPRWAWGNPTNSTLMKYDLKKS